MKRFIVIETHGSVDDQADQVRNVAKLIENGFHTGLNAQSRFETHAPLNHFTASDAIKAIQKNDN